MDDQFNPTPAEAAESDLFLNRTLVKKTETDTKSITAGGYVEEITRNLKDQQQIKDIREVVRSVVEQSNPDRDFCIISNAVGHQLTERGLYQCAVEAYEFAFAEEDPYALDNRSIYAGNVIRSVDDYLHTDSSDPAERASWLKQKRPTLREAQNCIIFAKNQQIYRQGYEEATRNGGSLEWVNQDRLANVNSLGASENIAKGVLNTVNMIP